MFSSSQKSQILLEKSQYLVSYEFYKFHAIFFWTSPVFKHIYDFHTNFFKTVHNHIVDSKFEWSNL